MKKSSKLPKNPTKSRVINSLLSEIFVIKVESKVLHVELRKAYMNEFNHKIGKNGKFEEQTK